MPAYNAAAYIADALDSVLAQTFSDWECIVVDDCSTDRTALIIEEYARRDRRIAGHVLGQNSGSAKLPRDRAVELARGEWIVSLDADDALAPDALRRLLARQKETGADFVALRMVYTDAALVPNGESVPKRDFNMARVIDGRWAVMLTIGEWVIGGATGALLHRRLWNGRRSSRLHMNADEYDSRYMLSQAAKVAFVDVPYYYRQNPASTTKKVSHKQFEPLITDSMLVGLVAGLFGAGSTQHRVAERAFLSSLAGSYLQFAEKCARLDAEGRAKALRLIGDAKREATRGRVLRSRLPWVKKAILVLPSSAIHAVARAAVASGANKIVRGR
jgi:glycosyltransferase involved in cell wall biosynthesis